MSSSHCSLTCIRNVNTASGSILFSRERNPQDQLPKFFLWASRHANRRFSSVRTYFDFHVNPISHINPLFPGLMRKSTYNLTSEVRRSTRNVHPSELWGEMLATKCNFYVRNFLKACLSFISFTECLVPFRFCQTFFWKGHIHLFIYV